MELLCPQCGETVDSEQSNSCLECGAAIACSTDATMVDETKTVAPPSGISIPSESRTVGRFEIIEPIGRGGMGHVVAAKEPVTDTIVALKMLRKELAKEPQMIESFLREARHMYQMSHPSILKVLEVSEPSDQPFFVMPMASASLVEKIRKNGALPQETILRYAIEIAQGLVYAHGKGLIHRDLKPANILLNEEDHAMIADFGLVRPFHSDPLIDLKHTIPEGTPAYMSPSVANGQVEDTRCDIYSFGALLYELLCGRPPYEDQNPLAVLEMVKSGPPKPIREGNPEADKALTLVSETCMARELRNRYASMADVLEDLHRIQKSQPPLGTAASAAPKERSKKPIFAGLAAAAILSGAMLFAKKNKPDEQPAPPTFAHPAHAQPRAAQSAEEQLEIARGYVEKGMIRMATESYRQILISSPDHSEARVGIIELLTQVGHSGPAKHELELLKKSDPNHPEIIRLKQQVDTMPAAGPNQFPPHRQGQMQRPAQPDDSRSLNPPKRKR